MASLVLTLYFANWCGHCGPLKPVWNELTNNIKDMGNKYNGVKIIVKKIEDSDAQKTGGAKINGEDIEGYPTIKFGLTAGGESKEYEYLKERDVDTVIDYVKKVCDGLAKA
jgi:hypothetical protein